MTNAQKRRVREILCYNSECQIEDSMLLFPAVDPDCEAGSDSWDASHGEVCDYAREVILRTLRPGDDPFQFGRPPTDENL